MPTLSRLPATAWSKRLFVLLSLLALADVPAQVPTYADPQAPVEARIDSGVLYGEPRP